MHSMQQHICSVPAALLPTAADVGKGQHPAPRQQREPRDLLCSHAALLTHGEVRRHAADQTKPRQPPQDTPAL